MDDDISELRDLVQKNVALAEDTNRMVHKMRRAQQWGRFFQLLWWVVVIAVSGATYYLYLQPYVGRIEQLYGEVQSGSQQIHSWNTQIQSFFRNAAPKSTETPTATTP